MVQYFPIGLSLQHSVNVAAHERVQRDLKDNGWIINTKSTFECTIQIRLVNAT